MGESPSREDGVERNSRRRRSPSEDSATRRKRRSRREDASRDDRRPSERRDQARHRSRDKYRDRDRGDDRERDDSRRSARRRSRSPTSRHRSHGHQSRRSRDSRSPRRRHDDTDAHAVAPYKSTDAAAGRRRDGPLPSQEVAFSKEQGGEEVKEKEKPNFAPTGLLAAASNAVHQVDGSTIVLKYHEPPEARKPSPKDQWKLFVFKGDEVVDTLELNARSCWLVGRELAVVDLAAEHPSLSKQHAVIQFRYIEKRNEYGDRLGRVRPYLIDLDSANGTKLNGEAIPSSRYLELQDKDLVQFGHSTREYVLMLAPRS